MHVVSVVGRRSAVRRCDWLCAAGDASSVAARQGAVEAVSCLVDSLWMDVLPYIVLLVVPVFGECPAGASLPPRVGSRG